MLPLQKSRHEDRYHICGVLSIILCMLSMQHSTHIKLFLKLYVTGNRHRTHYPLPHIYHLCNREVIGITIGHHLYVAGIAEQTYRITFCHPLYVAIVAEHTYRITICTCICLPLQSPVQQNSRILSLSVHVSVRGVATVRYFRHVPTHNFFPQFFLLMKNDKQSITYFNYYVCFMFIVLMTSFHKLKDKHL